MAERMLSDHSDEQILEALPRPAAAPHTLGEQAGIGYEVSGLANAWTAVANADRPGAGGLWAAFRADVRDLGLRDAVSQLPADPVHAIGRLLAVAVPRHAQVGYLSRLLAKDPAGPHTSSSATPGCWRICCPSGRRSTCSRPPRVVSDAGKPRRARPTGSGPWRRSPPSWNSCTPPTPTRRWPWRTN